MTDSPDIVETLEPRRLFASVLTIDGTGGNDLIEVAKGSKAYVVTVNGVAGPERAIDDVSAINIFCNDGDDILLVAANITLGVYADGGAGDDKMIGGDGPDTFLGASQKDILYGGLGNDRLNGAGGNDKVLGEAGGDRLYGGDGNDYIDGGSSGDRMYPGGGTDTVLGQGGDDNFFAIDSQVDQLFGGSGTDSAFADSLDERASLEHVALV